jgi:hypothetical protein
MNRQFETRKPKHHYLPLMQQEELLHRPFNKLIPDRYD